MLFPVVHHTRDRGEGQTGVGWSLAYGKPGLAHESKLFAKVKQAGQPVAFSSPLPVSLSLSFPLLILVVLQYFLFILTFLPFQNTQKDYLDIKHTINSCS